MVQSLSVNTVSAPLPHSRWPFSVGKLLLLSLFSSFTDFRFCVTVLASVSSSNWHKYPVSLLGPFQAGQINSMGIVEMQVETLFGSKFLCYGQHWDANRERPRKLFLLLHQSLESKSPSPPSLNTSQLVCSALCVSLQPSGNWHKGGHIDQKTPVQRCGENITRSKVLQ